MNPVRRLEAYVEAICGRRLKVLCCMPYGDRLSRSVFQLRLLKVRPAPYRTRQGYDTFCRDLFSVELLPPPSAYDSAILSAAGVFETLCLVRKVDTIIPLPACGRDQLVLKGISIDASSRFALSIFSASSCLKATIRCMIS